MPSKSLSEIKLKQTRTITEAGGNGETSRKIMPVSAKVDELIKKLGYSSAHTLGITTQLLTVGKIRVDFRDYHERLELMDMEDTLPMATAMTLAETYVASILTKDDGPIGVEPTQKVILEEPKPRPRK
jgi:hypothetical protein